MLELVLMVCLITDPSRCKDVALTYSAESVNPYTCVTRAQPEIAKWIEAHPKWVAKRWTCRAAGQTANL